MIPFGTNGFFKTAFSVVMSVLYAVCIYSKAGDIAKNDKIFYKEDLFASTNCKLNSGCLLFPSAVVPTFKLITYMLVMLAVFMAAYLCMTVFYNGKKGKHPNFAKWFFYIFYPLHYLIIFIVKIILDRL